MAMLPIKRLLLVAFLLLCFISITARARSLRETKELRSAEKGHGSNDQFKPNQGVEQDTGDLATMDYTPTAKNPPIHN